MQETVHGPLHSFAIILMHCAQVSAWMLTLESALTAALDSPARGALTSAGHGWEAQSCATSSAVALQNTVMPTWSQLPPARLWQSASASAPRACGSCAWLQNCSSTSTSSMPAYIAPCSQLCCIMSYHVFHAEVQSASSVHRDGTTSDAHVMLCVFVVNVIFMHGSDAIVEYVANGFLKGVVREDVGCPPSKSATYCACSSCAAGMWSTLPMHAMTAPSKTVLRI